MCYICSATCACICTHVYMCLYRAWHAAIWARSILSRNGARVSLGVEEGARYAVRSLASWSRSASASAVMINRKCSERDRAEVGAHASGSFSSAFAFLFGSDSCAHTAEARSLGPFGAADEGGALGKA